SSTATSWHSESEVDTIEIYSHSERDLTDSTRRPSTETLWHSEREATTAVTLSLSEGSKRRDKLSSYSTPRHRRHPHRILPYATPSAIVYHHHHHTLSYSRQRRRLRSVAPLTAPSLTQRLSPSLSLAAPPRVSLMY
ncbi:hypothetical protein PFISCL1PPCAC_2450, partial [Pristionchus fissidentatus]